MRDPEVLILKAFLSHGHLGKDCVTNFVRGMLIIAVDAVPVLLSIVRA